MTDNTEADVEAGVSDGELEKILHSKMLLKDEILDAYNKKHPERKKPLVCLTGESIMNFIDDSVSVSVIATGKFQPMLTVGWKDGMKSLRLKAQGNDWKAVHAWYLESIKHKEIKESFEKHRHEYPDYVAFTGRPDLWTGSDYGIVSLEAMGVEDDKYVEPMKEGRVYEFSKCGWSSSDKLLDKRDTWVHVAEVLKDKSKAFVTDEPFPISCPESRDGEIATAEDLENAFNDMIEELLSR